METMFGRRMAQDEVGMTPAHLIRFLTLTQSHYTSVYYFIFFRSRRTPQPCFSSHSATRSVKTDFTPDTGRLLALRNS